MALRKVLQRRLHMRVHTFKHLKLAQEFLCFQNRFVVLGSLLDVCSCFNIIAFHLNTGVRRREEGIGREEEKSREEKKREQKRSRRRKRWEREAKRGTRSEEIVSKCSNLLHLLLLNGLILLWLHSIELFVHIVVRLGCLWERFLCILSKQ